MNRLWVRLTLAFSLVVLAAVGGTALLISWMTGVEFRQYVTHSDMQASGSGLQQLIDYYQKQGNWEGVDGLLAEGVYVGEPLGREPPAESTGGESTGGEPPGMMPSGRPPARLDALLADADGKVVYDSAGDKEGKRLSSVERGRAMAITESDEGEVIGYLLLSFPSPSPRLGGLERQFLDRIRAVLVVAGGLAVIVGLVLGALLSRSLSAPLQRLAAAARAVGSGHLEQRVKVEGSAELAEVGRAFNDMTTALKSAEMQRKNLVADVAHELRTPLTVLQGNLRAILDDVYSLDKIEISRLYDETRLLSRLVDDLRELALADAGQLCLQTRATDAAQVIGDTLDVLVLGAEAQQVTIGAALPESLPMVQADPDRVGQVLRNLLVNALRHTPAGGSVTVSAAVVGDMVEIAVADTGEGIAAEDLPHVFERFWRADPARARQGQLSDSTGLGLSIAQSLITAQGGRIWAESSPGRGSTFRFTLPLAGGAPANGTPRTAAA